VLEAILAAVHRRIVHEEGSSSPHPNPPPQAGEGALASAMMELTERDKDGS
jgi:hypothetical protein